MSDRFYELLGVRPGVSVQELKSAYRDLTKVWHPDRFTHDLRLQQKAEEKLKEINDAYEQLVSRKTGRPRVSSQPSPVDRSNAVPHSQGAVVKSRPLIWLAVPLIVFGCVFFLTVRTLQNNRNREAQSAIEQQVSETPVGNTAETSSDSQAPDRSSGGTSLTDPRVIEQGAVPTTTVMIDSTTGLLALPECPTKIRMTYPSGSEPRAYCSGHRKTPATANPQQQSRLKSLEKKTASSPDDESEKSQPER
jgi:DnaJ domain